MSDKFWVKLLIIGKTIFVPPQVLVDLPTLGHPHLTLAARAGLAPLCLPPPKMPQYGGQGAYGVPGYQVRG